MAATRFVRNVLVGAVLAASAPGAALAQGQIRQGLGAQTMFPLRDGNSWTYARRSVGGTSEWTVSVSGRVTSPRMHPYFTLAGYFAGVPHQVRSDPFGTVTERSDGFRDHLWYLLGAPEGTSWSIQLTPSPLASPLPDCVSGAKLTLASRGEKVSVPAGEFERVVRVDWTSSCADAGIASEWFAPGVGLIRRDELSIAGAVTSELVRAELEGGPLPRVGYVTTLSLDRPLYVYNLMPPIGPGAIPVVAGSFAVHKRGDAPLVLAFGGCKSVAIAVVDETGNVVLTARGDDGGCCDCRTHVEWDFGDGPLLLPFAFKLADEKGQPLPDGRYAVTATLATRDAEPLRAAARAPIDVASTH
jgi:hypothetical protein